ncbi:MAG: dihydropteroate synthase [Planctomycetota bacterium]
MARTFGILNLTADSFSDGGRFLAPDDAVAQAHALLAAGADVLDLGAESTNPDGADVPPPEQVRRLSPLIVRLLTQGVELSVDSWRPEVMRAVLPLGVRWLNCVRGFREPGALEVAADAPRDVRFVVMFARGDDARARRDGDAHEVLAEVRAFFTERIAAFEQAGIARERLVLDPGMGFFLGPTAAPSLHVLRHLEALRAFELPLMVSVSRKSVVGEVTGRPVALRGAGTIAAELWAARHGAAWIRTHDVAAFRDAFAVERAIANA